jgi:hypothetical protein
MVNLSASGYDAWRSWPVSARATADADLTRCIRRVHAVAWNLWGAARSCRAEGRVPLCWPEADARLMRAAGIAGVSRRRSAPITTRQATDHHPASDLAEPGRAQFDRPDRGRAASPHGRRQPRALALGGQFCSPMWRQSRPGIVRKNRQASSQSRRRSRRQ